MPNQINSLILAVIPKEAFIDWLKEVIKLSNIQLPDTIPEPDVSNMYVNSPLFIVPVLDDADAYETYVENNYPHFFIHSLFLWCENEAYWPIKSRNEITRELFDEFFRLELHSRFYSIFRK